MCVYVYVCARAREAIAVGFSGRSPGGSSPEPDSDGTVGPDQGQDTDMYPAAIMGSQITASKKELLMPARYFLCFYFV